MSEDSNMGSEPNDNPPFNGAPPEWPNGAPLPTDRITEPSSSPLPLGEAVRQLPSQYIRVLTKPGAAVFAQEEGKAAWNITWVQIMLISVINVLVGLVAFNTTFPKSLASDHVSGPMLQVFRAYGGLFALSYIILTPIFFFIGVGIFHLFAKVFRGKGTFLAYGYCSLLYGVPLGIISGVLSIISSFLGLPSLAGLLLAGVVGIYDIILRIFMTMAVHRLSGGKATLAVLVLPTILFLLCFVLVFIGVFMFFVGHSR